MKYTKPLILILVLIASGVFFAERVGLLKKDSSICAPESVQETVNQLHDNIANNEAGITLRDRVDASIEEGYTRAKDKEKTLKANLEYSYRNEHGCEIAEDLEFEATENYQFDDVGVQCERGKYTALAERDYNEIKKNENHKYFAEKMFIDLTPQISPKKAQERFITRWENNEKFREIAMLAMLDIDLRQKHNCMNPNLPMERVNAEIKKQRQEEEKVKELMLKEKN